MCRLGVRLATGMDTVARWYDAHRGPAAIAAGFFLPLAVAAAMVPFRATFADAAAALVLVAVITLVATVGTRPAGYVAAISAGLWFDFFLTPPYEKLVMNHRTDIEITVSLLVVGIVITELAARGRRHQRRADEETSFVEPSTKSPNWLRLAAPSVRWSPEYAPPWSNSFRSVTVALTTPSQSRPSTKFAETDG